MSINQMSKDRIVFTIPSSRMHMGKQETSYRELITDVFGIQEFPLGNLRITCRPSQFARFLVERNNRGIQNQFSELNPVMVMTKVVDPISDVDASLYPHHKEKFHYKTEKPKK